jgi:transposase
MNGVTWDHNFSVCPKCGHKEGDAWDRFGNDDDVEVECSECEYVFNLERRVDVEYISSPKRK